MKEIKKIYQTDWLNSRPVFYNAKSGKVSENVNDVIDFANFEFHAEGLKNYLEFGYSVFGQTMLKDVRFLDCSSKFIQYSDNSFAIETEKEDPVDKYFGKVYKEDDVVEITREAVKKWEDECEGEFVVPLSGGYDARMLAMLVSDKSRARSFTFGVSKDQNDSYEVLYAKRMAEIMNMRWEQVRLGNFHNFIDQWDDLFGISVHSHGMYHMEFYDKLKKEHGIPNGLPMISGGLNGSIWAGEITLPKINNMHELGALAYSHGLRADRAQCLLKGDDENRERFWLKNEHKLKEEMYYRIVSSCRMKNMLLNYVLKVPDVFGFKSRAPYNDIEIALAMLNIPQERWLDRKWQVDLFRKNGIYVQDEIKKTNRENILDLCALHNVKPEELDAKLLSEVIDPKYVEWINKTLNKSDIAKAVARTSKIKFFRKKQEKFRDKITPAYNAYLTLRPIQNILKKRQKANDSKNN